MKTLYLKCLTALFILFLLCFCQKQKLATNFQQESLPKNTENFFEGNYWIEYKEKNNTFLTTDTHIFTLDSNYLYEYMGRLLIAKIPITYRDNKIIIRKDGKIISELSIKENGNIVNPTGIRYQKQNFPDFNPRARSSLAFQSQLDSGYDICIQLCKATHRLLGLGPKWDSICCFWYPK